MGTTTIGGRSQAENPEQRSWVAEAEMWLGACDGCNGIYVTAGLAPGETICPECRLPLRFIRDADGLDLCREALQRPSTSPLTPAPSSRRVA